MGDSRSEIIATMGMGGVPIYGLCAVVFCFEWGRDVRVYPEGPQCVVEIKYDHFWKREAIGKCFGGDDLLCHGTGV
jgi:hypothetical protein